MFCNFIPKKIGVYIIQTIKIHGTIDKQSYFRISKMLVEISLFIFEISHVLCEKSGILFFDSPTKVDGGVVRQIGCIVNLASACRQMKCLFSISVIAPRRAERPAGLGEHYPQHTVFFFAWFFKRLFRILNTWVGAIKDSRGVLCSICFSS